MPYRTPQSLELTTKRDAVWRRLELIVMPYWIVTPHEDQEYDSCILPASSEADHRAALEYAQAILESLWDSTAWEGSPKKVTVTMEIKKEDMPSFDDGAA